MGILFNDRTPLVKHMEDFNTRLITFLDWPITIPIEPADLAASGLMYSRNNDLCSCYYCGLQIRIWQATDIPMERHFQGSPLCPVVTAYILEKSTRKTSCW